MIFKSKFEFKNFTDNYSVIILITIISIGFFVRIDQFHIQTLIDDEWHSIHQILTKSPSAIFSNFGHSDHSIPLTLIYWLKSKLFGLNETLMRWPMLLFGLLTLFIFTIYVKRNYSNFQALIFCFLISLSPLLILYSRTARPYAITLFLVYFVIWCFYKYINNVPQRLKYGLVYSLSASLAIWLHLAVVFFVISPFLIEFYRIIFLKKNNKMNAVIPLFKLGIVTFIISLIILFPPFINSYSSLAVKTGMATPNLDTFIGALFLIFGTYSKFIIITFTILSLIGLPRLIKGNIILFNIVIGALLTILIIYISKPSWVFHSITFTRYLLPIIPLLLLSVASGTFVVFNFIKLHLLNNKSIIVTITKNIVLIVFSIYFIMFSPVLDLIRKPNSQTNHLVFKFEFRNEKNEFKKESKFRPISKYWEQLRLTPNKYKIAVSPWYHRSFEWDGPRWEQISNQHIIPGYLNDLCIENRKGEVPNNKYFNFNNVSYLASPQNMKLKQIDFIVFQKKLRFGKSYPQYSFETCIDKIQNIYDKPIYEDEYISVFKASK